MKKREEKGEGKGKDRDTEKKERERQREEREEMKREEGERQIEIVKLKYLSSFSFLYIQITFFHFYDDITKMTKMFVISLIQVNRQTNLIYMGDKEVNYIRPEILNKRNDQTGVFVSLPFFLYKKKKTKLI